MLVMSFNAENQYNCGWESSMSPCANSYSRMKKNCACFKILLPFLGNLCFTLMSSLSKGMTGLMLRCNHVSFQLHHFKIWISVSLQSSPELKVKVLCRYSWMCQWTSSMLQGSCRMGILFYTTTATSLASVYFDFSCLSCDAHSLGIYTRLRYGLIRKHPFKTCLPLVSLSGNFKGKADELNSRIEQCVPRERRRPLYDSHLLVSLARNRGIIEHTRFIEDHTSHCQVI